jgi:hypothetical protein
MFVDLRSVGMWESPCGLFFFERRIEGDRDFYRELYGKWNAACALPEYDPQGRIGLCAAARPSAPGDRVLEIGPGTRGIRS